MFGEKYHQRLKALFTDIDRLAASPAMEIVEVRSEIDCLRARLVDLEAEFHRREDRETGHEGVAAVANDVAGRLAPSAIYEKDRLGYVYAGNRLEPLHVESTELCLDSNAIKTQLTAGGEPIGELQVEQPSGREWTLEEKNLAYSVAHQVSLQIQNLRLLASRERALADAEAATRRFVREGWESYLDAIHESERIGFAYDQGSLQPYVEKLPVNSGFHESMAVMEEQVGALYVKTEPAHPLTEDDRDLLAAVARQVERQVESIRLLADASRARAEAEEATRSLTRRSWESYSAAMDKTTFGFIYDSNQVEPLTEADLPQNVNLVVPLTVRGETVGQLAIAGCETIPEDAVELTSAIAAQASSHVEALRLSDELKRRADEMGILNQVIAAASQTLDLNTILTTVLENVLGATGFSAGLVSLLNPATDVLEIGTIRNMPQPIEEKLRTTGLAGSLSAYVAETRQRMSIQDFANGGPVDVSGLVKNGLRSYLGVPIIGKGRILGTLCLFDANPHQSNEALLTLVESMANQTGIAIDNARLYAEQTATVAQLRELDRLKSSFLANMSHELRTPLNSILGFADVMLAQFDGPLTENMGTDLQLIQKNGQHLLHLINDVLDMAKIEAGRMNMVSEQFLVQDVLEEVLAITSTLAVNPQVEVGMDPTSDRGIRLSADRTRLRQVMINLVSNAVKFTEKGCISIRVQLVPKDKALISVKDTGVGIPPDKLETIFQEFAQIDTSTTRKAGGTGLGLPISRRLVEMHGGRLWAESMGVGGEGSTFFVELPLEAAFAEPVEKTVR